MQNEISFILDAFEVYANPFQTYFPKLLTANARGKQKWICACTYHIRIRTVMHTPKIA